MNSTVNTAATEQRGVCGVNDHVHVLPRQIANDNHDTVF
jgi:hypothetical protein